MYMCIIYVYINICYDLDECFNYINKNKLINWMLCNNLVNL